MPRPQADAAAGLKQANAAKDAGRALGEPGSFSGWERLVFDLFRAYYDGTGQTATSAFAHCFQPAIDQEANGQAAVAPANPDASCRVFCSTLIYHPQLHLAQRLRHGKPFH